MEGPAAPNPENPDNNTNGNANQNNDNNAPAGPPNAPPQQPPNQPAPQQLPNQPTPQQLPNQPAPSIYQISQISQPQIKPALQQPPPQQPAPANPTGPFQPVPNWPQPVPHQPVPQIIHQQLVNWSHLKSQFAGKPEEDAEAHLLCTNDWMRTHNFDEDVKVKRFCLTLLEEARLWHEILTPIANYLLALQNAFR